MTFRGNMTFKPNRLMLDSGKQGLLKSQLPFVLSVKGDEVGRKNAHLSPQLSFPPVVLRVGLCDNGDAITQSKGQITRLLSSESMHGCGYESAT